MTALHFAVRGGFSDLVQCLLINHNANVNAKDFRGLPALFYAAQNGNIEAVRLLLSDGRLQDVNARCNGGDATVLMRACSSGYSEIVRLLLAHPKIDVNIKESRGYTALVHAVMIHFGGTERGHIECVSMLLADARVDVDIKTADGRSVFACCCNDTVRSLLSKKRVFKSSSLPATVPAPAWVAPKSLRAVHSASNAPPEPTLPSKHMRTVESMHEEVHKEFER